MISRTHVFCALGLILIVLGTLVILGTAATPIQAQSPLGRLGMDATPIQAQSESLYQNVQRAAAGGDEQAEKILSRAHAFFQRQGIQVPPVEREIRVVDRVNGIPVSVKGIEPIYLKIYNLQEFKDLNELEAYIEKRKTTLKQLASKSPDRQIEVQVNFNDYTEIAQVWQLKQAHGLDVSNIVILGYLNGEYHSSMAIGEPEEAGAKASIDFTESAAAIERQLKTGMPAGLLVRVARIEGTIRAKDAVTLDDEDAVMLVDPITDLLDAYSGRAVDVRVVKLPHLLKRRNFLQGKPYAATEGVK